MEKYCRAGQATDDSEILCIRIACQIPKATNTPSEYVILLLHGNSGCTNSPQRYFIRPLLVLCHVCAHECVQAHAITHPFFNNV